MLLRVSSALNRLTLATAFSVFGLSGCENYLDKRYESTLPPDQGSLALVGLEDAVSVRRNTFGMPLIEGKSFHDAIFALGYVHASDRLSQMITLRLTAEGRLAEMVGPGVLDLDRFMRALNLKQSAKILYRNASPRLRLLFEVYSRGVNAYIYRHQDKLPMDLAASGYHPDYWQPEDSALVFCLLNVGLSVNLQEEIAALILVQRVDAKRLAWLLPTYPDEPLPFAEAEKLEGLTLSGQVPGLAALERTTGLMAQLNPLGVAASNAWAIAGRNSTSGKPILANDTHLLLSMPSYWNFVQIRSPIFQGAGITIAGIPAIIAGFNGKVAWGMTMVMGDNQDLFLEQVRREGGRLLYLADGEWQAAPERQETFFIKGQQPIRETLYETRNGPLLNDVLGARQHAIQPLPLASSYGLALKSVPLDDDQSLDAFFDLSRTKSLEQAFAAARRIRTPALNMLLADENSIGWQITGRFPNRRQGLGLVPSPGWDDRYGWDGFADPMLHPYDQDPPQGWLGNANQRSVARGYGMQLSASWYYPERYERLAELAAAGKQDMRSTIAMQYDQVTSFAGKLKTMLQAPGMAKPLAQAIAALREDERHKAGEALDRLLSFDGRLAVASADAALYEAFLHQSAREIFLDELGPEDSPAWRALVQASSFSYSAQADHLLGQEDSPFWDDRKTSQQEDKPAILARSLVAAVTFLETRLGSDRKSWQWGKLHTYTWASGPTQLAPHMSATQRAGIQAIQGYLDRGPYPAGGDHDTLNASAYRWGESFDTWLIPAMRIIVDFGRDEPLVGLNSSGQSGNPASPHYADGIDAWMKGQYMSFPFKPGNQERIYGSKRLLLMPKQQPARR